MKSITFILPTGANKPIGGYKVIFEYANYLCGNGYKINLIFPNSIENGYKIKKIIKYFVFKLLKKYKPSKWFSLKENINCIYVFEVSEKNIPDADIIFATAATTAKIVNNLPFKKGEKHYLIQSYENWSITEKDLIETWKMPMKKVVISKALLKKAKEMRLEATYIPNGIDSRDFYIDSSILKEENTLMMLYHSNEKVKQSNKALDKLIMLKKINPELKLILFGTLKKPNDIPNWVEYHYLPSKELLRKLYNRANLFISPSAIEGWALPPAEAMFCGTAVCVTNIDGHEYVEDQKNGYLIQSDLSDLIEKVKKITENNKELKEISKEGNQYIKQYNWNDSGKRLVELIECGN